MQAKRFSATFVSDGIVRSAEAPLGFILGWPDDRVRAVVRKNKWTATVIAQTAEPSPDDERVIKDPEYQPIVFRCAICGAYACYGYGVNLRADRIGTWYCPQHKPGRGVNG